MDIPYSTEIAARGFSVAPQGVRWNESTRCACCGRSIHPGDMASHADFGPSFMDDTSLAARSGVLCGWCAPFMRKDLLRATQKIVATRDGVYSIAKDDERAWLLLTPPDPPWVAVVSDSQQQHLIWRTPATLDNAVMTIRLGHRLLRIRRHILPEALARAQAAMEIFAEADKKKNASSTARHPFVFLDREMKDPRHGAIRGDIEKRAATSADLAGHLDWLKRLTPGETWALASLAKSKTPTPMRSEPIALD